MAQTNQVPDFEAMAREMLKDAPRDIAERARAFFLSSFIKEGFTDISFIPWVKRMDPETPHKILSASLALRDSVKIQEARFERIEIRAGEGIPYAAIHNNGGTIVVTVTERMRKFFWAMYMKTENDKWKWMALTKNTQLNIQIPKRQFIGESETLNNNVGKWITKHILNAEKNLKFK